MSVGQRAGARLGNSSGYIGIKIDGILYQAHRLAFLYVHGFLPATIDHINQSKVDNRIVNLRGCTRSQNAANSRTRKSKFGFRGVSKKNGKFQAKITHNYKSIYLGVHDTPEEASAAYEAKKAELFGEFA